MSECTEYVYLLQERESIKLNQTVYKFGRTAQCNLKRASQYPKGSVLLLYVKCVNSVKVESDMKKLFKEKYVQRLDYGTQYFEGDYKSMMQDIFAMACTSLPLQDKPLPLQCDKCYKVFKRRWMLTRHADICKGNINKLQCTYCLKVFKHRSNVCQHLKTCKTKAEMDSKALTGIPENKPD
jgi:hypothetical protein